MTILGAEGGVDKVEGADVLVVLLHAFAQTPASLSRVAFAVREAIPRSDLYAPRLPPGLFAVADPDKVVGEVALGIRRLDEDRRREPSAAPYRELIVVGHSAGAVLARRLVAQATLQLASDGATADPGPRWSDRITRVVLLAATNRGWMVSSALDPFRRLQWTLGSAIGHLMRHALGLEPYIFGFRRGAPFLTSTRLQWLEATRHRRKMGKRCRSRCSSSAPTTTMWRPRTTSISRRVRSLCTSRSRGPPTSESSNLDQGDGGEDAKQKFQLALTADPARLHELR